MSVVFELEVGPLGWAHVLAFGIALPILVVRRKAAFERTAATVERKRAMRQTLFQALAFAGFSAVVADQHWIDLFPAVMPSAFDLLVGAAALAVAVGVMRPYWKRAVERRSPVVRYISPSDRSERWLWLAISLAAGIGEEITWRGVQTTLVAWLTGSEPLAIACAVVAFAVLHSLQGWRSVAIIAVFALGFHGLVLLSGTLYVAMGVHVAYDLIAGLSYGRLVREHEARLAAETHAAPAEQELDRGRATNVDEPPA